MEIEKEPLVRPGTHPAGTRNQHRVGKLGRHRKEGSCEGEQGIFEFPQIDESMK